MRSTCKCHTPPGGSGSCAPTDLAICRVIRGKCNSSCHSIPSGLTQNQSLNWQIGIITEKKRPLSLQLTQRDMRIMTSGEYTYQAGNGEIVTVTFHSPTLGRLR